MENQDYTLLSLTKEESSEKSGWHKLESMEDVVFYRYGNPPMQRHLEVSLASAENVTWWKGIELVRKSDNTIVRQIETQDNNHGANEFEFGLDNFDRPENYILYLCKAKEFGIHRRMYYLPVEQIFNTRIEFYWQKD